MTRPLWNPYEYMGERHPDWVIRFDDLYGIPEIMCWDRRVMLIEHADGVHKRRCSMAHAVGHLELMHQGSVFCRKEEAAANKWAAGMLIDVDRLADAAEWHHWTIGEPLAHDLRVDLDTLIIRVGMARTHPAERPYLDARRAQMEHVA